MGRISLTLSQFGTVEDKKAVLKSLEEDASALSGAWKVYADQGLSVFDVSLIERIDLTQALSSLGIALAVENPVVDDLLLYIDGPQSGFRDPAQADVRDAKMMAAVRQGFVKARQYGFKALSFKPLFERVDADDLDSYEYEDMQRQLSDYDNHIKYHLPVPRLYAKGKALGECHVRSPRLYEALFDHNICQTRQQLRDMSCNKDYDALEKLSSFEDVPDFIQDIVRDQMQSFDYLATLDARRRLLGNGEMNMSESKMRLESAFRAMANHGTDQDATALIHGIQSFEFSRGFIEQGLQQTVDGIVQEYIKKPVGLADPAAPEVYDQVFATLARHGLEVDTTAVMAKERVDFFKAKDWKAESGSLLPKILKGIGSPSNPMVKGALMAAIKGFPIPEVLNQCDVSNERQMKALYQVTGCQEFVGKMSHSGRDRVFAMDMGL